ILRRQPKPFSIPHPQPINSLKALPPKWNHLHEYRPNALLHTDQFGQKWIVDPFIGRSSSLKDEKGENNLSEGLVRNTDPFTSHEAAATVEVTGAEKAVLDALVAAGDSGLIAPELATKTGLPLNTVSARTRPLVNKGLIVDSGETRKGPSGRRQIVWKVKSIN